MSRVFLKAVAACAMSAFFLSMIFGNLTAQTASTVQQQRGVLMTKLSPPAYPKIALTAHRHGNVVVELRIGRDGSVESADFVSGDALLTQAALNSAKASTFECRECTSDGVTYRLTYTFRLDVVPIDPIPDNCGKTAPTTKAPKISQETDHVILTSQVGEYFDCVMSKKVRSAKCLFLWKCGSVLD